MEHVKLDEILNLIFEFAESTDQILAVGLCGSWARGAARPNSDIDLSIIVEDKKRFKRKDWIEELDFEKINEKVENFRDVFMVKCGRDMSSSIIILKLSFPLLKKLGQTAKILMKEHARLYQKDSRLFMTHN